ENRPHRYNPIAISVASLIVPGAGQALCGHYVRGAFFFAGATGIGLYTLNQAQYGVYLKQSHQLWSDRWNDSLRRYTSMLSDTQSGITPAYLDTFTIKGRMRNDLNKYDEGQNALGVEHAALWLAGLWIYNCADAVQKSGWFYSEGPKSPVAAGWLAAIPGLGLGQLYNGSFSKAGMIFMTQVNLGLMAYDHHRSMRACEDKLAQLAVSNTVENVLSPDFHDAWDGRRLDSFRKRNTYLWYSLGWYFYALFDAIVDAHLHDAPRQLRLTPEMISQDKEFGLHLAYTF
ncbi:MAG: DUF5683 domain-containing protein, partial [Chitinivibrionales bacterium]|nr:DUF5683 domain-containing protein [Chitinivibrionales bacterium]